MSISARAQRTYDRWDLNPPIIIEINGLIDTKGEISRVALRLKEESA